MIEGGGEKSSSPFLYARLAPRPAGSLTFDSIGGRRRCPRVLVPRTAAARWWRFGILLERITMEDQELIATQIDHLRVIIELVPERAYELQRILTDANIGWYSWNAKKGMEWAWIDQA